METIDEVINLAGLEGLPIAQEASGWSKARKTAWYENMMRHDNSVDIAIDDIIEYRYHNHKRG